MKKVEKKYSREGNVVNLNSGNHVIPIAIAVDAGWAKIIVNDLNKA